MDDKIASNDMRLEKEKSKLDAMTNFVVHRTVEVFETVNKNCQKKMELLMLTLKQGKGKVESTLSGF